MDNFVAHNPFPSTYDFDRPHPGGRYLAEVYNIIYQGDHDLKPEEQLGTIKVDDDIYGQYLYRVTAVDMSKPTIEFGDEVILTGPNVVPISSGGPLVIDFDLFCGSYKDSIDIDYYEGSSGYPREKRIISEDGTGEIYVLYALFNDATEAHLEIKLLTSGNSATDVHGVVAARTSKIECPAHTSILFLKKPDYKIKVGHGELVPLSRSIVVVPLEHKLFLDIHLRGDDDEICKGTLPFDAKLSGTSEDTLHGKNGDIKVNITWKGTKDSEATSSDSEAMSSDSEEKAEIYVLYVLFNDAVEAHLEVLSCSLVTTLLLLMFVELLLLGLSELSALHIQVCCL